MTKEEIFIAIEEALVSRLLLIIWQQEGYHQLRGHYFQGKVTHSSIPSDGEEVAPDLLQEKPTDQEESWLAVTGLPEKMLSRLRSDIYDGPLGPGYVLSLEVIIEGEHYVRAFNFGPESDRESPWNLFPDLAI